MLLVLGQSSSAQHEPSGESLRKIYLQSLNITQGLVKIGDILKERLVGLSLTLEEEGVKYGSQLNPFIILPCRIQTSQQQIQAILYCVQLDPACTARTFMATPFERP